MPLDARIRHGLHADAAAHEPPVDTALNSIAHRGPRRRVVRTLGRAAAVAAIAGVFVVAGVAALRMVGEARRSPAQPVPHPVVTPIDGQWKLSISVEDAIQSGFAYGRASQLAGPRQLELASGVVRQIRPGSFQTVPVNGLFEVDGPFLIVRDQGETLVLRWNISGDQLRLTLVDDSRSGRAAREDRLAWTSRTWRRVG